jgi:chromosome partitioning protein
MAAKIAVVSQKGGVGKTTLCLNLATAHAERGRRVLIVDLDPLGSITHSLGRQDVDWAGVADIMMKIVGVEEAIIQTKIPTLSILARGRLNPTQASEFEQMVHRPQFLESILAEVDDRFDMILIDTPAGLGMVPRAALRVSDFVLIPFQTEPLALRSISQVLQVIEHVRNTENPGLNMLGILPTMVDISKKSSQEVLATIWNGFANVFDTVIPRADVFAEASRCCRPVSLMGGAKSPDTQKLEIVAAQIEAKVDRIMNQEKGDAQAAPRDLI